MKRKGAVVIVSAIVIVIALIGVSSILMKTYLSGLTFPKSDFREKVTQISTSSRGATAIALADVSKRLSQREKTAAPSPYYDWSKIEPSTEEINSGLTLLQTFQNNVRQSYPSSGLMLNYHNPTFAFNWTDPTSKMGYSRTTANVTIDLKSQGFEGLNNNIFIETNAKIKNLIETDGNSTVFTIEVAAEKNNVVNNLKKDLIKAYFAKYTYNKEYRELTEFQLNSLQYVGEKYVLDCTIGFDTIDANVNNLIQYVNALQSADFISTDYRAVVIGLLNDVKSKYASYHGGDRSQPWLMDAWAQLFEFRLKMDPSLPSSVIKSGVSTTDILTLSDITLSQLRPVIRVVLTDNRGITVSAYGEAGSGTIGPLILNEKVTPSGNTYILTCIADDHLGGNSVVEKVEYVLSDSSSSIPVGAIPHEMSAVDGIFDEPIESVSATILNSDLYPTTTYIWIRAKDVAGEWSHYTNAFIKIPGLIIMQKIDSVENDYILMQGFRRTSGPQYYYRVEATIFVKNALGVPLEGVTVQGRWSGAYSWSGVASDIGGGYYRFQTPERRLNQWLPHSGNAIFNFQVYSLSKQGYQWNGSPQSDRLQLTPTGNWIP